MSGGAPIAAAILDPASLAGLVERSPEWPYGSVRIERSTRIGAGYGLSDGAVYRVEAEAERGPVRSFVVKHESAEAVERALLFHRSTGTALRGTVPDCFGGAVDRAEGRGLLFLEDVHPARQGDVLHGCTEQEAESAVRSLARVHAVSWSTDADRFVPGATRWSAQPLEPEVWDERLSHAAAEFPQLLSPPLVERLRGLPALVASAIASLAAGPVSWIHRDAHLDNVLFRPDGTAVLIDWSGAAVGSPAVDLARLLTEGLDAGADPERAARLVAAYGEELDRVTPDELWSSLSDALTLVLQSAVAWAGLEETREPRARMLALRENLLRSACAWES